MRGREVLMNSLVAQGVDCLFGNPGTTESPLLDSLADHPQITYYMALHEGVAVGAAKGYAEASGKVGVVNLHVAPGLGNAMGMLYSVLKARTPMLVTAGQQDTRLRLREPVLGHDLAAMAAPVVKWAGEPANADELRLMLHRAFTIAQAPPAGPVFVALPIDVMEQETEIGTQPPQQWHDRPQVSASGLDVAVEALLGSTAPGVIAGDNVATARASAALVELAERLGAPVWHEPLRVQAAFPSRHPSNQGGIPFTAAAVCSALADRDLVLLVGADLIPELWFDPGPQLPEGARIIQICESEGRLAANHRVDIGLVGGLADALRRINNQLAERGDGAFKAAAADRNTVLRAAQEAQRRRDGEALRKVWDARPMTPKRALHEISIQLPPEVVIVDETITGYRDVEALFDFRGPGDYFAGRGGGIGQGIASALGVQVALPGRPVVALTGDGSAMYSIQALWTAAHYGLPVIFVVLSNREYRVLKHNIDLYRHRFNVPSNRAYPHMDLTNPTLGFVEMANGMGVSAEQASNPEALAAALRRGLASGKPYLIDVVVSGKQ